MFLSSSLRGPTNVLNSKLRTCAVETKIEAQSFEFISDWTFIVRAWQRFTPLLAPAKPERGLQPEYLFPLTSYHSYAMKSMIADTILISRCRKILQWHNFPAGGVNCFPRSSYASCIRGNKLNSPAPVVNHYRARSLALSVKMLIF